MIENSNNTAHSGGFGSLMNIRIVVKFLAMVTFVSLGLSKVAAQQVEDFYVPLPETAALTFFDNINADASTPLITRTDIVIRENGTEIIYDPFANGYESQYADDSLWAASTELWGDSDCSNGFNPNHTACDAGTPDVLDIGEVLVFDQTEAFSRDYFRSNRTINLTRSLWPSVANTLLAGAFELFPTSQWGTDYILPIGEGTTNITGSGAMFEQVAVTIMARDDNTTVQFDPDGSGAAPAIVSVLDRGETAEFGLGGGANGQALNIVTGATIATDAPVQANVMTGDIGSNYEARFYTLFPNSLLSNVYYESVGSSDTGNPAAVFMYNPSLTASITIEIYNNSDPTDTTPATQVVPANSTRKVVVPGATGQGLTGLRLESVGGEIFSAYTVVDDNDQAHDWGHVTTPLRLMGDTVRVGFAPGRDPLSGSSQNASPVWVIADLPGAGTSQDIAICVDADGDGGPNTDPATGRQYDYTFTAQPLDSTRLYDNGVAGNSVNNNGGAQTGMLAFACDPGVQGDTAAPASVLMAAAWGQDPQFASAASPGFDVGTTIRTGSNNRLFIGDLIFEDLDGDGEQDLNELGLANVNVTITVANPAIDIDPTTPGVQNTLTTQTDANGVYIFSNLTSGEDYTVDVTPPAGYLPVSDPDGTLDNGTTVTLTASTLEQDFGYSRAVIGDFIYRDNDFSGSQTPGDTGLQGVEVELCYDQPTINAADNFNTVSYSNNLADWNGNSWIETGDDGSPSGGSFNITGNRMRMSVDGGTFTRALDLTGVNNDVTLTMDWAGGTGDFESNDLTEVQVDIGDGNGFTTLHTFIGADATAGPNETVITSGGSNSGLNGTLVLTFNPQGSNNVRIRFSQVQHNGGNEDLFIDNLSVTFAGGQTCEATTTDANGYYVFAGLLDRDYTVEVDPNGNTLPLGATQTADPDAVLDGMSAVTVAGGVGSLNEDFGYLVTMCPMISVSFDEYDLATATGTTIVNSEYETLGADNTNSPLPIGYGFSITATGGTNDAVFYNTTPGTGGQDLDLETSDTGNALIVQNDATATGGTGEGGYIPNDFPGGILTFDFETPLTAFAARLVDFETTGVALRFTDTSTNTTVSVTHGDLVNPASPFYQPECPTPAGDANCQITVPITASALGLARFDRVAYDMSPDDISGGIDELELTFECNGAIVGDTIFVDDNSDGIQDPGEVGLENVDVTITATNAGVDVDPNTPGVQQSLTVPTDSNGNYLFTELPFGEEYTITVTPPVGIVQVSDPDGTLDNQSQVTPYGPNLVQDFGYQIPPASISGNVSDTEGNNLVGVIIELYSDPNNDGDPADGVLIASTTTDASGNYIFSDVAPGSYVVSEIDPAGYVSFSDGDSTDGGDDQPNVSITDNLIPVAVIPGEQDTGNDFVDTQVGAISGQVWLDEDQDGINDIEEAGLTNVVVELRDGTCTPGVDCATLLTDQFGNYAFNDLPAGDYDVAVISGLPAGLTNTFGPFGAPVRSVTLPAGDQIVDQDFGYIANANTGIIGDRVWSDADGDGIQDLGEAGIEGVTLVLLDANGNQVGAPVTTGADGDYLFSGVPFGEDYTVSITDTGNVLAGFTPTVGPQSEGGLVSDPVTLDASLTTVTDVDFGFDNPATLSITDRVWYDADGSQTQDAGEPGIAGVTVDLLDSDGNIVASTTTDANGDFTFSGIPDDSDYAIVVSDRDNELDGLNETTGTNGSAIISGPLSAAAGGDNLLDTIGDDGTPTFGYNNPGSIAGTLWSDADSNEVQNDGEPGIGGVTVTLTPPAGVDLGNGVGQPITTVTNPDGSYLFDGLPPGDYTIDVLDPPAGVHTQDPDGDDDNNATVTLGLGESVIDQDFGYADPALFDISGTVFLDTDKDGVEEEAGADGILGTPDDEPGFADVTLALSVAEYEVIDGSLDVNRDGVVNGADDGSYLGFAIINGRPDLNGDGLTNGADDGVINGVTIINGRFDTNGDGDVSGGAGGREDDDAILPSVEIATTTTDADGNYSFVGLPDAEYEVAVTDSAGLLSGYDITSGLDVLPVTLAGADETDVDFGYIKDEATGSISGEVFLDENGNNLAETTEANYGGVDVYLCSGPVANEPCDPTDPEYLMMTVTDANGEYSFNGLTAGNYVVDVDSTDLPAGLDNTVDPAPVALSEGESVDEVDFGYVPAAGNGLISGTTWIDADSNGVFDAGESPLGGVTINVFDPNSATPGTPIGTIVTAADGTWELSLSGPTLVDDLIVEYVASINPSLDFTQPTNLPPGVTSYSNDDVDVASDADRFIGDLNFGFPPATGVNLGSISGTIYSDADQNGDYLDTVDGEFEGVSINLLDGSGNVIATTMTDENGNYSFTGLLDDSYSVVVTDIDNVLQDLNVNETITLPIVIAGGNDVTDVDQGYISEPTPNLSSIGNLIFIDVNENGFADDGEPRVPGVTVQCWADNDQSSTPNDPAIPVAANDPEPGVDNLVRTVTTDDNGEYYCTNLPTGQYIVNVTDVNGVLAGYADTSPNNTANNPGDNFAKPFTYAVTTVAGTPNLTADFGVVAPSSISGTVYFDDDSNGDFEPPAGGTDSPLEGIAVEACDANDVCITVYTEPDGSYTIPVGPGDWTVTVLTPPMGTSPLEQPSNPVTVNLGDDITEIDFGYIDGGSEKTGIIRGNVSEDTTGDDAGDTPIPGVIVQLYSDPNGDGNPDDGELLATDTTDGAGNYEFVVNLNSGTANFVVLEVDPAGYASVSDAQSIDSDVAANTNTNDNLIPVTLSADEIDANNDFVDVLPASVAGTVWLDEDRDGINDIEEAGLTGIVVELVDDGGNVVATTSTDQFGNYVFDDVPPGNYTVNVDDTSLPPGLQATAGPGGIDPKPVSVLPGDMVEDIDFGYLAVPNTGAIGDRVWSDANSNGIQDPGEIGIAGVTLTLLDDAGNAVGSSVVSGSDGDYLFTNVPFGDDYTVVIAPADPVLSGYTPTSGPQSEGGYTGTPVTLSATLSTVTDRDFGFNLANSNTITDTVWFDENGDGVFDAGEAPLSGVTVNLYEDANLDGIPDDNDGDGQPDVVATATTDENGDVSFTGLPDGTYILELTDTGSELQGLNGTTPEAVATFSDPVAVAGGVTDDQNSFGFNNPGLIAGTVFTDGNGANGQEPGEAGLGNITVTLREDTTGDGNFDTVVATVQTNPDGSYEFDGLPPGDYQVTVTPPAGTQTEDPDAALDDVTEITLGIGESSVGNNFGYNNPALADISGTVFLDTDKDGVEEPNGNDGVPGTADDEPGFAGVTIDLIDAAGNVIASTTTDANGDYSFPDLPAGDYQVAVTDKSGLIAGYDLTSGLNVRPVTLAAVDIEDVDFGYIKDEATGSISGEVFIDEILSGDTATNGVADDPETNLSGVTIFLCLAADAPCNAGNAVATTVTDVNGEYVFNDLPAGQYVVDADPATIPADLDLTVDPAPVALSEGENVTGVDVGYEPDANTGVLSGFVWTDVDGDGNYDPAEAPIAGVDIIVYSNDGTNLVEIARGTTGPDGKWIVSGISGADLQDNLLVTYDDADIPAALESTQPTNLPLGDDLYNPVDLLSDPDNNISYLDFAFPPAVGANLGSIAGTIYSDANEDGDYVPADDGELQGVTVNLLDDAGNIIASTQTDANGMYLFDGLIDGDYTVVVTDRGNVLQDLNPNEVIGDPITIVGGADITDQDAGYISDADLGSIGNRFWFDTNGDGINDDNEPGVEGVVLQLWLDNDNSETPDNPNGTTNAPQPGVDNLVRTVTTDENGEYYFTSLPAGQYIVVVADAAGFDEAADGTVIPGGAGDGLAKPWTYALTKVEGTPNFAADFGVAGNNSIAGKIFIEDESLVEPAGDTPVGGTELDGVTTPTGGSNPNDVSPDVPAEGVTVVLLIEQPDGSFDEVQRTTTDANGDYSFAGLPDGNYRVQVLPSGSPIDGFGQTGDPDLAGGATASDLVCDSDTAALCDDQTTITLANDQVTGIDFGYQKNFVTTPVTINQFSSVGGNGSVEFSWETSNEVGHVGYQLYARTDAAWVLLNDELISREDGGDALQTRRYNYTAYNVDATWFALVDVSAAEELTIHGPYQLGESYGAAVEELPEFDWSRVAIPAATRSEVERSVQARLRALQSVNDDDGAYDVDADDEEDDSFESAAHSGGQN